MHRFFISPERISHDRVVITGSQAHHLKNVLRLTIGDRIIVLDNTGLEYQVELLDIKVKEIRGEVVERRQCPNDPCVEITLYQSILKGNKFDWVLQKCTEVGAAAFVPIICERNVAGWPSETRMKRWRQIILEAAEQSRRAKLPELYTAIDFRQSCERRICGPSIMPWEGEESRGLKAAIGNAPDAKRLNVFIGPEGGFSESEVGFARSRGIAPVTLGRRIFRADTAGLVAITAILYEKGELGDSLT